MRLKNDFKIRITDVVGKEFEFSYLKLVGEFREIIKQVCGNKYEARVYSIIPLRASNNLCINFALIDTTKKTKRVVITDVAFYKPVYKHFAKSPFLFQDKLGDAENAFLSTKNVLKESIYCHNTIFPEKFAEIVKTL